MAVRFDAWGVTSAGIGAAKCRSEFSLWRSVTVAAENLSENKARILW
jgi:hypothetical protein